MADNLHIEQWLDEWVKGRATENPPGDIQPGELEQLQQEHQVAAVAIQRYQVLQQLQQVHRAHIQKQSGGRVISMKRAWMRIAAVLILVVGGTLVYQYQSNSPEIIYGEMYSTYYIDKNRGTATNGSDEMVNAFRSGDYEKVTRLFGGLAAPAQRELFLAGNAFIETGAPGKAIDLFNRIREYNGKTGEKLYQDEAEYYLGLAYLKAGKDKQALEIFHSIRKDRNHTYYDKINGWLLFRLKWF